MKKSLLYLAGIITSIALLAGCDIKGAPEMINLDDETEVSVENEIKDENYILTDKEIDNLQTKNDFAYTFFFQIRHSIVYIGVK